MRIKIFDDRLEIPKYATEGSSAFDLRVVRLYKDTGCGYQWIEPIVDKLIIKSGNKLLLGTGIAIDLTSCPMSEYIPKAGLVFIRSSWGKKGLSLTNSVGLIDTDYQGEILLSVINNSNKDLSIFPLERIAQLMIVPHYKVTGFSVVDSFKDSERGDGGFGSTGNL